MKKIPNKYLAIIQTEGKITNVNKHEMRETTNDYHQTKANSKRQHIKPKMS